MAQLPQSFYEELQQLQQQGTMPLIVHGGGPAISDMLTKLQIQTQFVNGLRKTDEAVLDVVEMVLAGQMNKEIVRHIVAAGGQALGLSGTDGGLIKARPVANADEIGFVGEVSAVNAKLLHGMMELGYIPVISPVGLDSAGQRYNINADTAAGAVASAVGAAQMIVVTDVPGILGTIGGRQELLPVVTESEIGKMIDSGEIYGGMIPKVEAALKCIQGDVSEVVIVSGEENNSLTRILQGEPVGTRITKQ